MRLAALVTVYNEAKFLEASLNSIKDYVDDIVIVEGAYQETIKLGKPARSDDGTLDIIRDAIQKHGWDKIREIRINEKSDAQQRNVGLQQIKAWFDPDWLLIVDGDEVYKPHMFKMIRQAMKSNIDAYVFSCLTFVNDLNHYCKQQFPRLFKVYPDTKFTNDNFVSSHGRDWAELKHGILDVQYYHYAFLKGLDRFETKKKWWESRFAEPFHYDWFSKNGKIIPESHEIYEYNGSHPVQIVDKFKV